MHLLNRLKVDREHTDLFAVIKPVIHRVLSTRWGSVNKHCTVPTFLQRYQDQLALLFPTAHMQSIIDAGDDWLHLCPLAVNALHGVGGLGGTMFAGKLKDLVESQVHKLFVQELDAAVAAVVKKNVVCGTEEIAMWRDVMMTRVEEDVQNLHLLPSKRHVTVPYRNAEVKQVSVSCLADHADMLIVGKLKAAAISAGFLPEMDCEIMLGFAETPACKALKVNRELFVKARARYFLK